MAAVAINHHLLSMRNAFATLPLVLSLCLWRRKVVGNLCVKLLPQYIFEPPLFLDFKSEEDVMRRHCAEMKTLSSCLVVVLCTLENAIE